MARPRPGCACAQAAVSCGRCGPLLALLSSRSVLSRFQSWSLKGITETVQKDLTELANGVTAVTQGDDAEEDRR